MGDSCPHAKSKTAPHTCSSIIERCIVGLQNGGLAPGSAALCSRPPSLLGGEVTSFRHVIHPRGNVQHGGLVSRPGSAAVRRLSRCLRQKMRVSPRRVSPSGDPRQEVQPGDRRRPTCPRAVRVLSPSPQGRAQNPGTRHKPVPSGDYNQRHGAAGGAWTRSRVLPHAERAGENTV